MRPLYTLGLRMYGLAISLAAPFKPKARNWVQGRKNWREELAAAVQGRSGWTWFHCASLGEFEQGRPLIEAIRAAEPDAAILLTFFSPSGYEIRKNYALADHVCYLPLDTPANARDFLEIVQPQRAFFIKYDLWLNLLEGLRERKTPHYLVSALLRADSRFLRSRLRSQYREALGQFTWIFAQDQETLDLLADFTGRQNAILTGDSRFDRAAQLPGNFEEVPGIADFIAGRRCIVVGSSYEVEEKMLLQAREALAKWDLAWIVAPHEIDKARIGAQVAAGGGRMARYSELERSAGGADWLWIDNVGMLSRLYRYAAVAYVGGGFGKTVHNTQEPAAYGNPVIFGPHYQHFREAVDMVGLGSAFSIQSAEELIQVFENLLSDEEALNELRERNRAYMERMSGATRLIMEKLKE